MSVSETEFQFVKAAAVGASLLFATALQALLPYRRSFIRQVANWKVNFPLAVLNLVGITAVCGGCACSVARWAGENGIGLLNHLLIPLPWQIAIGVLVLDLTAYFWHRANHELSFLWRFHAVHHSDQWFDASTAVRFHPGEIMISLGVRVGVVAVLGIPVEGILAFEMIYAGFNFFEHGNIRLAPSVERAAGAAFVTPALHRKHHSVVRSELNSNFGTIFSIWDRLFRTYLASSSSEQISVGLSGDGESETRVARLLTLPFRSGSDAA